MRILFIGDVVGKPGRAGLERAMPQLREEHSPDLVIANGENSAGGLGVTEKTAAELHAMGVDAITLGNHVYRHRDVYEYLDRDERIVRPANYMKSSPGRGVTVIEAAGRRVGVVSLSGQVQMRAARSPFPEADSIVDGLEDRADVVFVDFHAEVTSEKVAMGWHLDGRVAAVVGTHTHVPTADARVLPKGTAFISDAGMTGSRDSVLGVRWEQALQGFRTQLPVRFTTAEENIWVNAVVVSVRDDGLAESIEQVLLPAPD
ncbi:MAG: TIGR00282 family metallophosphoesterase [Solirubrobacterales bacterium]